jgi:hypothetical protein
LFDVKDLEGKKIGEMHKVNKSCFKACATDVDFFEFEFPESMAPRDRVLFLGSVLFTDYMFFESVSTPCCQQWRHSCVVGVGFVLVGGLFIPWACLCTAAGSHPPTCTSYTMAGLMTDRYTRVLRGNFQKEGN